MRRYVLAVVLFVAGLTARGWADDAAMSGIGGTVKPMKSHPSVVMESERVVVRLTQDEAKVDCTFVFRNTGETTEVTMGFPESGSGGDSEPDSFEEFQAWVDGKPVAVRRVTGRDVEDGYQLWWTKTVAFGAGQTRTVRNTYRSRLGGGVGNAGGFVSSFGYVLSTGASWKGKIGSVEVTVKLIGLAAEDVNLYPKGYTRGPRQVTWRWQNLEPTEKHDIGISFGQGGDALLYVDGYGWFEFEGYEGPRWGPRLEGKRVFALAKNVAYWVGASLSWDARAKTATLSKGARRVTVTVGKRTASMNSKALPLGGTPRLAGEGHLEIPVQAVAEAFGAAVRFDPLNEETYLHTPKALAAARRPKWLDRQLTEKELKGKSADHRRLPMSELQEMRNEIYARRGREFQNLEIRRHFYRQSWYEPNPKYSDALLSEVDRANIALIQRVEKNSEESS